ncbi:MAG: hydroxyacylglutathione hydrolase [Thalassospira sp.]|nr:MULTISPECIES: hydroxyacylglutathione hydrolase [Thalassospira]MBL4841160.1 hydroxyacylglutathione hydrolase [Thalassospira sp.]PXX30971.1 hydroxyacylglutathione hydrolase [Thalassospira sp. 11-3]HBN51204.1 hydroxyacylglutathione hydrolase [Thalassospira sp.]|tara:strand:- start:24045 stop:24815 length:771 start_codon:yes stop_codon:yes gene_type:complete
MSAGDVFVIPCLSDNYIYLVRCHETGTTVIVDPGEAGPVISALEDRGWSLDIVINTHHHNDHIGGNAELIARYGAKLIGPKAETMRIPGMDQTVAEGDEVMIGALSGQVFDVPGHTSGHIAFYFPAVSALFSGDSLFALGCGRLFEGTPAQMWQSLQKFRNLPGETLVYCGHEYTQSNARFAATIETDNVALKARCAEIDDLRARGIPTIPSRMDKELATNPFLRADHASVASDLGMEGATATEIFAEIRGRKDRF